ncbi:MAG: hypothetical protein AABW80_00620 [Nanoarchaeota archaeon]
MKFEIPLTENQRYALRITAGFNGLPLGFTQRNLKEARIDDATIPNTELPVWKREFREQDRILEEKSRDNITQLTNFYKKHSHLYAQCIAGRNRDDAIIAFKEALSLNELQELERLNQKGMSIFEEQEMIRHKEVARYQRHSSKLLGIIGIAKVVDDVQEGMLPETYNSRLIPPENLEAVKAGVSSGFFVKDIASQDREILRHIYIKYWGGSPSSFSLVQTALEMNLTDISSVQESIYRLSGLICHLYLPKSLRESFTHGKVLDYNDKWFIPKARIGLVKEVLRK